VPENTDTDAVDVEIVDCEPCPGSATCEGMAAAGRSGVLPPDHHHHLDGGFVAHGPDCADLPMAPSPYREAETVEEFIEHGPWVPLGITSSPPVTGHALLGLLSPAAQRELDPWRMLRTTAEFIRWTVPEAGYEGISDERPGHVKDRLVLADQLEVLAERLMADRSEAFARQAAQAGRGSAGRALDRVAGIGWSAVQRVGWELYSRAARALGAIEDR
jgi:hypothetical protein